MSYTVQQLATLANVSVRTLHYYDQIGLLKPARVPGNGYRRYEEAELLKLQQILFFRELDFPLEEIQRILSAPNFDMSAALHDQRRLLELKKKRLSGLLKTIDKTINKLTQQTTMKDQELYSDFSDEQIQQYAAEAKQRWGHTDAYKQSMERYSRMSKEDIKRLQQQADIFMKEVAASMDEGPASAKFQRLIAQHYESLKTWYEPNLEMYRGLADLYVDDPRFTAYYEKYAPGLAVFMREAMIAYCDAQAAKS